MEKIITTLFIALAIMTPLAIIHANWGTGITDIGTNFSLPDSTPKNILTYFLKWLLEILAIIAALAFVISGIMFITSGGNSDQATRAKDYIKYSIIGLVVSLSAYIVIVFISDLLGAGVAP